MLTPLSLTSLIVARVDQLLLADTAALAAVALVGYIFGRRTRTEENSAPNAALVLELARARRVSGELEQIARRIRNELAGCQASISTFQSQIGRMETQSAETDWRALGECADELVSPTVRLTSNLALAYDELRTTQAQLMTFATSRVDPTTGLQNRRAIEEQLEAQVSLHSEGKRHFSLALFSVSVAGDDGTSDGQERLQRVAPLLADTIRGNDFIARYSSDELLVLMPQTTLSGALVFSERLLRQADMDLSCLLWGGVVEAIAGETADRILSRADAALYSARTQGTACLFVHAGGVIRRHAFEPATQTGNSDSKPTAPPRRQTIGKGASESPEVLHEASTV